MLSENLPPIRPSSLHRWQTPAGSRWRRLASAFLVATSLLGSASAAQLPAFPGAEGFGSLTPGGRGGRLLKVTSLADSGTGTLRAALDTVPAYSGEPRIIVFAVGGVINGAYNTILRVKYPFTTIAGQTAPGGGICIKGAALTVQTHDVIIRGIRARVGDLGVFGQSPDSFNITNWSDAGFTQTTDVYNIIVDHCSFSWGVDSNADIWEQYPSNGTQVRDITFSWCINSEALARSIHNEADPAGHSTGGTTGERADRLSFHHNLFASNDIRNLLIRTGEQVEFVNNVVYNWGREATNVVPKGTGSIPPTFLNALGNYYKSGPSTVDCDDAPGEKRRGLAFKFDLPSGSLLYVNDNIGPGRPTNTGDQWAMTTGKAPFLLPAITSAYRATGVIAVANSGTVTVDSPTAAYDLVLANAGALAPARDSTDARVVANVVNGTGAMIDFVENSQANSGRFTVPPAFVGVPGGYPVYASGTAPTDTDNDGIPDAWETANGLNPNSAADANTLAPSGYTWIEEYINSLIPNPRTVVVFNDDFEDGNSNGWTPVSGTWSVVTDGSKVYQQSALTKNAHTYAGTTNWANATVESRVKVTAWASTGVGRTGIFGRWTDTNNHYYLGLFKDNTLQLQNKVGGVITTLASTPYTVATGVWYTLELSMNGNTLNAYVNNVLKLTVTDSSFATGKIGVGGWNATARFDDVIVTQP